MVINELRLKSLYFTDCAPGGAIWVHIWMGWY